MKDRKRRATHEMTEVDMVVNNNAYNSPKSLIYGFQTFKQAAQMMSSHSL